MMLLLVTIRTAVSVVRICFLGMPALALENTALRYQLLLYRHERRRPRLRPRHRTILVALSRLFPAWRRWILVVQPETVLAWHRRRWRILWARISRPGRPPIPPDEIALIRRISADHPEWGEDKIALELRLKLGVERAPSTIRRYMTPRKPGRPNRGQTWRTFLANHAGRIWLADFSTQYTVRFRMYYLFAVMELRTRRIVHWNVTDHPTLPWIQQQIRHAIADNPSPRFLVHDNDQKYGQTRRTVVDNETGRRTTYRSTFDRWLDETKGIRGVPIPYGAPNAIAWIERF